MMNPPYVSHGPSRNYDPYNYVVPSLAGTIVFRGYVPPHMPGGELFYQSYSYGYMVPSSQGIPQYQIHVHPYMDHIGGGYYLIGQGHGLY